MEKFIYRVFIGFILAAVISPLIAHIPPHKEWVAFVVGIVAAIAYAAYDIFKTYKSEIAKYGAAFVRIGRVWGFLVGGILGGCIGALAAHFI